MPLYTLSKVVAGSALLVCGLIPVALRKSEGAGSVETLVFLPGAHLYIQVLGNLITNTVALVGPQLFHRMCRNSIIFVTDIRNDLSFV
jgi:hypothetical protein